SQRPRLVFHRLQPLDGQGKHGRFAELADEFERGRELGDGLGGEGTGQAEREGSSSHIGTPAGHTAKGADRTILTAPAGASGAESDRHSTRRSTRGGPEWFPGHRDTGRVCWFGALRGPGVAYNRQRRLEAMACSRSFPAPWRARLSQRSSNGWSTG